jgi:hypothetical protein
MRILNRLFARVWNFGFGRVLMIACVRRWRGI